MKFLQQEKFQEQFHLQIQIVVLKIPEKTELRKPVKNIRQKPENQNLEFRQKVPNTKNISYHPQYKKVIIFYSIHRTFLTFQFYEVPNSVPEECQSGPK